MDYVYSAKIEWVEDVWIASVPAFSGCFGDGKTKKEALINCAEALRLFIASYLDGGRPLPKEETEDDVVAILCVEVDSEFIEESKCLTTKQAAEELSVSPGRVSQLVKTGALDAVFVNGKKMITVASVNNRKKEGAKVGRPRGRR